MCRIVYLEPKRAMLLEQCIIWDTQLSPSARKNREMCTLVEMALCSIEAALDGILSGASSIYQPELS